MTLPTARSTLPLKLDCMLVANSGELVPKATTVRPIMSGLIPRKAAKREAPRTSNSAPLNNKISPPISNNAVLI